VSTVNTRTDPETQRLSQAMSAVHAALDTPELREELMWLLDTLTTWWAGPAANRHMQRRHTFTAFAAQHHPKYAQQAVPLREVLDAACARAAANRADGCRNPRHDHTNADGEPLACPDCDQPCHYDDEAQFYVHDTSEDDCLLTAPAARGTPCRRGGEA
jgi:hypothetical protein